MFAWTHSGSLHAGRVAELLQIFPGPGQAANQSIKACTTILESSTLTGWHANPVFRQHAASIYGFVRMFGRLFRLFRFVKNFICLNAQAYIA